MADPFAEFLAQEAADKSERRRHESDPFKAFLRNPESLAHESDPFKAFLEDEDAGIRAAEEARRIAMGEALRSDKLENVNRLIARGLWAEPMPGTVPMVEQDPEIAEAARSAARMGVPGVAQGLDTDEPSFWEKAGSLAKTGATFALPTGRSPTGLASEVQEMFRPKFTPPGEVSVRRPTALSTGMDIAETPARILVAAPAMAWSEGRPADVFEYMGKAVPLPSWQPGVAPRDNFAAYQSFVKNKVGGDPSDWKHIVGGFVFSLADPAFLVAGAGGAPKALLATHQAALIGGGLKSVGVGRRIMRGLGVVGKELDVQTASLARQITDDIHGAGSVRKARGAVRERLVDLFGEQAGKQLDALGESWGETGIRVGLPLTPRVEVVSAKTLRKSKEIGEDILGALKPGAVVDVAQDIASKIPGVPVKAPLNRERKSALDAINAVGRAFRTDLEGGFRGWDGALEFYEDSRIVRDPFEHERGVVIGQLARVARKLTSSPGGRKGVPDPFHMGLGELVDYSKKPGLAEDAERQFGQAVLNSPYRASTQRMDEGIFDLPDIEANDLEATNILRRGYSNAVIRGRRLLKDTARDLGYESAADLMKQADDPLESRALSALEVEVAEDFHRYVQGAFVQNGMAEDMADQLARTAMGKAQSAIFKDTGAYSELMDSLSDRVAIMLKHNESTLDRMLQSERKIFKSFATQAAKRVREASIRSGLSKRDAASSAKDAYQKVMARAPEELENYFMHYIRDRNMIRRRVEVAPGAAGEAPGKHRTFLDVVENYEAMQNPSDDLMQSLAARTYAHIRFKEKAAVADLVFGDRRWARPVSRLRHPNTVTHHDYGKYSAKGADWGEKIHPITGEVYLVRNEAADYLDRAISMHDPGVLEKMFRTVDGFMGRWKSYATHARAAFYNIRNWIDDGVRMHMAGFNHNPVTYEEAVRIGMLRHLEQDLPVLATERALRKPRKGVWAKGRKYLDKRRDALHVRLAKDVAERKIRTVDGREITYADVYRAAIRTGIVDKSFVSADLATDLPESMQFAKQWDPREMVAKTVKFWSQDNPVFGTHGFLLKSTGNLARWNENLRRMTLFVDRLKAGEAVDDAARSVKLWLFDYKDLTRFEREAARRIMPFYTFSRKNLPAQIRSMLDQPGKYLALGKAKRAVEARADHEFGPIGAVRDYMDDLWAWRLPTQTEQGSPVFWNLGLSMTDVNLFGVPGRPGEGGDPEIFDRVSPLWDILKLSAAALGTYDYRSPLTGRKIKGTYMEPDPGLKWLLDKAGVTDRLPTPTGGSYPVVPTAVVMAYRKLFPHLVAYGRVFAQERDDPYQAEQMPFRRLREAAGISLMPNNPLRAETDALRKLEEGPLASVARNPLGIIPGD